MSEYRAYFLDDGGRRVTAAHDLEALDDQDAVARAAALGGGGDTLELWRIDRFLCRFEPIRATTREHST